MFLSAMAHICEELGLSESAAEYSSALAIILLTTQHINTMMWHEGLSARPGRTRAAAQAGDSQGESHQGQQQEGEEMQLLPAVPVPALPGALQDKSQSGRTWQPSPGLYSSYQVDSYFTYLASSHIWLLQSEPSAGQRLC